MQNILLVGYGNVAYFFGSVFQKKAINVTISGRSEEKAKELANSIGAQFINLEKARELNFDLVLITVSDRAIEFMADYFVDTHAVVAHTSGATSIDVLKKLKSPAVVYPLQTISKQAVSEISQVPLLIESDYSLLKQFFEKLGFSTQFVTSQERLNYHLAAVFVNNFVNHLYTQAKNMLDRKNLDWSLLFPLIRETAINATVNSPEAIQTGPAKRNDEVTIQKHVSLLADSKELLKLYNLFTQLIQNQYSDK
jgi:predicted short-subunit dehydrogenase-like oxidoreductase (DUF2520 family)